MEKQQLAAHLAQQQQQQQQHTPDDDAPAPAYTAVAAAASSSSRTTLRPSGSIRKPVPAFDDAAHKPLPIPVQPPHTSPTTDSFLPHNSPSAAMATYPPSEPYPNPHETRKGEHDYTHAYDNAVPATTAASGNGAAHVSDEPRDTTPEPATGPTRGVGVPSSYNAFISFPLLSAWYPSTAAHPNEYYDANVSGPRVYPPPLEARGLTEARFMQIQHFACSIRADSQRNKGLLCCGLGILLGGLGCVLIDHKCVGNKPLRDKVNRWAFENVNPRLEHEGIEVRFAYQKNALRAYFKDT